MMDEFEAVEIETGETTIFARWSGSGPPILLLHGFPETHLMWRSVAPMLARRFTVVCPDLRGYGRSGCPPSSPDHTPYAKRALARDVVTVMERLGFQRFSVVGHDRGGRVAYRSGPLDTWYAAAGGPLALWKDWCDDVQGDALDAGHLFPEECPETTAEALTRFFATGAS